MRRTLELLGASSPPLALFCLGGSLASFRLAGSLRDVAGLAGYVLSDSGRRYVLVAIVNHPNANAARPALDALVQWSLRDAPAR